MADLTISIKIAVLIDEFKAKLKEAHDTLKNLGTGANNNLNLTSNADALKTKILDLKNQLNLLNSGGATVNLTSNADELKNKIKALEQELLVLNNTSSRVNLTSNASNAGNTRNTNTGGANLNGVGAAAKKELDDIGNSAKGLQGVVNNVFSDIKSTIAGAFAVGAIIGFTSKLIETIRVLQDLRVRLSGLTKSDEDYAASEAYLIDLANRHHKSVQDLSTGYASFLALEQSGIITRQQSMQLLEGFSDIQTKTGASSVQLGQSLYGLSQAAGTGVVNMQDFRQATEPLIGLTASIAKAYGISVGELRKNIADGAVESVDFMRKVVIATHDFEGASARAGGTITATYADASNAYTAMAKELEKPVASAAVGAVDVGKSAYGWIKDNGSAIVTTFTLLAVTVAGKVASSFVAAAVGAKELYQAQVATASSAAEISTATIALAEADVVATTETLNLAESLLTRSRAELMTEASALALADTTLAQARANLTTAESAQVLGGSTYDVRVATQALAVAEQERTVILGKMQVLAREQAATSVAITEAQIAQTASTEALTAATNTTGVAMGRIASAGKAAFSLIGGWVGVAVIAIYGLVKAVESLTDAEGRANERSLALETSLKTMQDQVKALASEDVDIDFSKTMQSIDDLQAKLDNLSISDKVKQYFGYGVGSSLDRELEVQQQRATALTDKKLADIENFDASKLPVEQRPSALKDTQAEIDGTKARIEELKKALTDDNRSESDMLVATNEKKLAMLTSKLSAIQGEIDRAGNTDKVDPKIAEAQAKAEEKALEGSFKVKEDAIKNAYELATAEAGKDAAKKLQIDKDYNEKTLKLTLERLDAEKAAKLKANDVSGKKTKEPELQAALAEIENKRTIAIADAENQRALLGVKGKDNADKLQESQQSAQFEVEKNRIDVELAKAQAESKTAIEELKRLKDEGGLGGSGKFDNEIKAASQKHGFDYEAVQAQFSQSAQKHGVPEDLLKAQVKQESNFNPNAGSSAGAVGFSQFIKGTANQYGLTDRNDPIASIEAQAKMMGEKIKQYNGRLDLALAAYNGGDGGANYLAKNPQYLQTPDHNAPASAWKNQTASYQKKILSSAGMSGDGKGSDEKQLIDQTITGTQHYYEALTKEQGKGIEASIKAVKAKLALAEKEYSAKKASATPEELPKIEADYTTNKAKLTQELSQLQSQLLQIKKSGDAEMAKEIEKAKQEEIDTTEKADTHLVQIAEEEAKQELELGNISNAQFLEKQKAFEAQRYQIALKAAQDRRALLAEGDTSGKAKALAQETTLQNKHASDVKAINQKMALDSQASFNSIAAPIKSAFGSTIQGILQGTTTLKDGMKNAFQSIVLSYVGSLSNMAIDAAAHWAWELLGFGAKETTKGAIKVTSEGAQTAATVGGIAVREGAEQASSLKSIAISVMTGLKKIGNLAVSAAAGAFSGVMDTVPPPFSFILAPVAAAAAFVGTMMFGGMMSSAGGEWDVPQDRLNLVHKNETILPATIAAPMREFFTNGGIGNVGLPSQANPTDSVASAGLAVTATSALATQQAMMQTQQKQQRQATGGGTVVINTKGGDFIHKDDLAKVLKNDNRNFRTVK